MNRISRARLHQRQIVNWLVTVGSVFLCLLLLPMRLPGIELAGTAPNWLLIWVVAWSVKRTVVQGAIAGIILGLLQDGMTSPLPSHALSLAVVGIITARLRKQRYLQEDFISVALIVFGMAVLAEVITAAQFSFWSAAIAGKYTASINNFAEVWTYYQRVALASAIVSSLWAPVVYYPLNRWWEKMKD
ncbi:rod shape-determining protein MreD [Chroogloeocystis siderophila]|uniref:rod shape-determining protein MreD n=1 Tax=Chroogloeocystis siderophila TaxID=329163 RepID=UPI000AA75E7F|nr:rod shape-determining protein MreD [Chroogloeocystis siderophila]